MPMSDGIAAIDANDSIEALFAHRSGASHAIYTTTVLLTIGALGGAAFTNVDLTIRAPATLAASMDRQTLRSTADGVVQQMAISLGRRVRAGDTLVALSADVTQRALDASATALEAQQRHRADLQCLLALRFDDAARPPQISVLQLERSRADARAADVEWRQATIPVTRADKTRERQALLLAKGFAAPAELEAADFDLARAREDRTLAYERRRAAWAEELAVADQQVVELERDVAAKRADRTGRYMTTPVGGTIEELMPITAGSTVRAGDAIATISPDGELVADALVSPKDVGYLKPGMPARLLVEGYDVQEWGAADGIITSVASDYTLADGHPVFRVRIQPARAELRRANGVVVRLGKGLRAQVRILLGRKRVAQLLTKRAREWFDPVPAQ